MAQKKNLAWWYKRAVEDDGLTVSQDQERIKKIAGTGYTPSRFKHFLRGERSPRKEVREQFMKRAVPDILEQHLGTRPTKAQTTAIINSLS